MAEPNAPLNDSGQKPKKDFWDILDITGKGAIAVVLAVFGWNIQQSNRPDSESRSTKRDFAPTE